MGLEIPAPRLRPFRKLGAVQLPLIQSTLIIVAMVRATCVQHVVTTRFACSPLGATMMKVLPLSFDFKDFCSYVVHSLRVFD